MSEQLPDSHGTDPWFLDYDDNTVIQFSTEGSSGTLGYRQGINPNETDCSITSEGIISIVGGLPTDFSIESGSISRFSDRLSLFVEEFTPSRIGGSPLVLPLPFPKKGYLARYNFLNVESVGTSDGTPNQIFTAGNIIVLPTFGTPIVFVGGLNVERWQRTLDLSMESPTARVFEYNDTIGEITFGDGVNGAIPEDGKEIILRISIRDGGGHWAFEGIVVSPGFASLGGVKSVRDKIIYATAPLTSLDASDVVSVTSTINSRTQNIVNDSDVLLETLTEWCFDYGGEIEVSGGGFTVINGTLGYLSQSGLFTPLSGPGVGQNHGTNIPAPGDTAHPLLNVTHGAFSFSGAGTLTASPFGTIVEPCRLTLTTSGDATFNLSVLPIQYVFERQVFVGVGAPRYEFYFSCWHSPLHSQSRLHLGWNPTLQIHTGVDDSSNDDIPGLASGPAILVNGRPFPTGPTGVILPRASLAVEVDRTTRIVEIADIVGSFASPVRSETDRLNAVYTINGDATYSHIAFSRGVPGDTTRHPEWGRMVYEVGSTGDAVPIETYYFGSMLPNHTTTFTAVEGENEQLPDRNENVSPGLNDLPRGGILNKLP